MSKTKGKAVNPVDALRKKQREKELKKNKLKKEFAKLSKHLSKSNTEELKRQLQEIENAEKSGRQLDSSTKNKKKILLEILSDRPQEHTPSHKTNNNSSNQNNDLSSLYPYPKMSIYYHPIRNPYGAPPPGMPMTYIKGFDPNDEYNYLLDFDNVDDIPPPPSDGDDKNIPLPPDESQVPPPFMNFQYPPPPPGIVPMTPPPGIPLPMNIPNHPPPPIPPSYGYVPPPPGIKKQAPFIPPNYSQNPPPPSHFKLPPQKIQKTFDQRDDKIHKNIELKTQNDVISEKEVEEVTQLIPTSVLMKRKLQK